MRQLGFGWRVAAATFAVGLMVGWFVLGWGLWPQAPHNALPSNLGDANA